MKPKRVCVLYFSPTGGTEKIARFAAERLAAGLEIKLDAFNLTRPDNRQTDFQFGGDDLLVMASPVYAGRLPNKLMPEFKARIHGEHTPAVPICVFGNRSPDEALRELILLLEDNGFQIAGAAAFAGRHAFSDKVGAGRPDGADLAQIENFAHRVVEKLAQDSLPLFDVDRSEIGPYYVPKREDGTPAKFLKARPLTNPDKCIRCGLCARSCPMGSIDGKTMEAAGLCIKCQACVRGCPRGAKYFEDADFLSHVSMLEQNFTSRADNVILV